MSVVQIPIEEEYKKHPEIKPEDIKKLREWLKTQPHLPSKYTTDLDILMAYHCCERSSEVTKQLLDLNLTVRTMFPMLQNRTLTKSLKNVFNTFIATPLKGCTLKGNRILLLSILDPDPKNFFHLEIVKFMIMVIDHWQYTEGTIPGLALVIDMRNFSLSHLNRLEVPVLQESNFYMQEAMIIRLQEIHYINAPKSMDKIMLFLRPFLKDHLEIIQTHPSLESLESHVDKSVLPKDYGGQYLDIDTLRDEQWKKIKASEDLFINIAKKRVDETKRPGKSKTISSVLGGVEGSFKKLNLD